MRTLFYGMRWRWLAGSLLFFLVLTASGCSTPKSTVSGQVTHGGKPLTGGVVTFLTNDDRAFVGNIDAQGHYTIPNVPRGQVRIYLTVSTRGALPSSTGQKGPPPGALPEGVANPYANLGKAGGSSENIPYKYLDPGTSGLTLTVTQENETYNIQIP